MTTPPTQVRRLPVTAAVLARGAETGIGTLLRESAVVRDRLTDAGFRTAVEPGLRRRHAVVVIWCLPAAVFDDDAWPAPAGTPSDQLPAARRAEASTWLAQQGIALIPISLI